MLSFRPEQSVGLHAAYADQMPFSVEYGGIMYHNMVITLLSHSFMTLQQVKAVK